MTALELFTHLAPLVAPALEEKFHRRDLCVLATRVVIDVAAYFGVVVEPLPCRAMIYNKQWRAHMNSDEEIDVKKWEKLDGSWCVGIGMADRPVPYGKWAGHLIATAEGIFGDFAVNQAERPQYKLFTGTAILGPMSPAREWWLENDFETIIAYKRIADDRYLSSPDWKDEQRRHRIVGQLIRTVRGGLCKSY
jgi:hypothetical protein